MSALLASLALAFLSRMRTDAEESSLVLREAQAHIMLLAGCNYVMETSRLGWQANPGAALTGAEAADGWPNGFAGTPQYPEGFGWVDVRDGRWGPRDQYGNLVTLPPAGSPSGTPGVVPKWIDLRIPRADRPSMIGTMYVERLPPFAIRPLVAPNAIATTGAKAGMPYANNRDPLPAIDPNADLNRWRNGDTRRDPTAMAASWFRVYRDGLANPGPPGGPGPGPSPSDYAIAPATFIITCGAGDSLGFKTWKEVQDNGATDMFNNDQVYFESVVLPNENYLWYRVEWNASVGSSDYQNIQNEWGDRRIDGYLQRPLNRSQESRCQGRMVNMVGTISFVQRLRERPDFW